MGVCLCLASQYVQLVLGWADGDLHISIVQSVAMYKSVAGGDTVHECSWRS